MSSNKPPVELPDTDDPYVLLDVRPGASAEQIRRAYLRRVKVFKPDRRPAEFRRIREAYDRLREQEAWFDAWRQANEVVRQAQREAQEGEPAESDESAAVAAQAPEGEDDEPSLEEIMDELEEELRVAREATGSDEDFDDEDVSDLAEAISAAEQLEALTEAIHEDLLSERYVEATARLLDPRCHGLTHQPEFSILLLEVCCVVVWVARPLFAELEARYGDLIDEGDTEHQEGALLHRRTLVGEVEGWREKVSDWPELHRFVVLGSSLRAPLEAELGLRLGRRAAADPAAFLEVLAHAAVQAPGIVALYVGMAERWARLYGRMPPQVTAPAEGLPTVADAAHSLVRTARTHRWVRWEQTRPLLVLLVLGVVLVWSHSPIIELSILAAVLVLWAWQAWAGDPVERIYVRVLRPEAATWLWATKASPDELAMALLAQLPARGTWSAVAHPGDMTKYPSFIGNDLVLLAFCVTAPMIPLLSGRERGGAH